MRIAKIKISNILGISELELSPQGYTQISGTNGTGKTSVLQAIQAALKTGHDATLLRNGAESGEAVLVLDDGTEISKKMTATSSSTTIRNAEGKKIAKPAEVIQGLIDVLSVNPVEFLLASKKERVRVLLDSMPLEVDYVRLAQISGITPPEGHALTVIEAVYKQVYDDRTGTNRAIKEKEATTSQLRQAVPELPEGVEGNENEIAQRIEAVTAMRDSTLQKIAGKLQGIEDEASSKILAIRQEMQIKIDEVNAELNVQRSKATAAREAAVAKHTETTRPLRDSMTAIRTNRDALARRAGTLEMIDKLDEEAAHLRQDAERQTTSLAAIEAYKSELLSSLPIEGLEVREGEIYRHNVLLDRLNTAAQVQIAIEVAKLRAGDLGIACVDRVESLDKDSRDALRKGALEAGLQLFITRVTDDDFRVNTAN